LPQRLAKDARVHCAVLKLRAGPPRRRRLPPCGGGSSGRSGPSRPSRRRRRRARGRAAPVPSGPNSVPATTPSSSGSSPRREVLRRLTAVPLVDVPPVSSRLESFARAAGPGRRERRQDAP